MSEAMKLNRVPVLSDFAEQGALYDGLMRTLRDGTYVHAYLISGLAGMGKRSLARAMAQYLLCMGDEKPCGACPACVQVMEGNHPDVMVVSPGKPLSPDVRSGMAGIPVDEIRYVIAQAGQHTFTGGQRVIVIEQADKMNQPAQNALLKTLEEPIAGTMFLLLTDAPELLLPTIISRCRALKMHPWPDDMVLGVLYAHGVADEMAHRALAVCGGSIGQAISVAADEDFWKRRQDVLQDFFALEGRSDILRVSGAWRERKEDAEGLLNDLEDMIRSLMLVSLGNRDHASIQEFPAAWQKMAESAELNSFINLMAAVSEARKLRGSQVTWQAVLEKLLLRLMEEKSKWST